MNSSSEIDISTLPDGDKFKLLNKRINVLKKRFYKSNEENLINLAKTTKTSNEATAKLEEVEGIIKEFKVNITSFTFQLISIIMGIFALILSVMFLWVNSEQLVTKWIFFYQATIIFFIFLITTFVFAWISKNFLKEVKYFYAGTIIIFILMIILLFYDNIINLIG